MGRGAKVQIDTRDVDRRFYQEHLLGFLPPRIIDLHTHVWLKRFRSAPTGGARGPTWPRRVAEDHPIEDLLGAYELMLPLQQVTPLIFGWPERDADLEQTNTYTSDVAQERGLPALIVTTPGWSAADLEQRVMGGRFLGLKPYLDQAPHHIPTPDITIYDFLPHHHLEVADAHGWIVLLHIPRPARLKDPVNLQHLVEIERRYPHVRIVVAHIGRAYCAEDIGNAFDVLRSTQSMLFDFSANTNAVVMERALRAVSARRVVFGSDLPIVRMRMRRVCEDGSYINLVPPGLYGNTSGDSHMREVSPAVGEQLSFFLYEQLWAFRCAAERCCLSDADIADVFYNNATRLLAEVERG
jgi:hypothetical protein